MEFFTTGILENREVVSLVLGRTELHDRGMQLAAYIARTGNRIRVDDPVAQLIVLMFLADHALRVNSAQGVGEDVTIATLKDVNVWTENYYRQFGRYGLNQFQWLLNHYTGNLFRLGRLQFMLIPAGEHAPAGHFVIDTHIPQGDALTPEICEASFDAARRFFRKRYPEFSMAYFRCGSWMLDDRLECFLDGDSNLVRFMRRWTGKYPLREETPSILERVFGFGFDMKALEDAPEDTRLQRKLKEYMLRGGKCGAMEGYMKI